jgi:hypothetical protein
VFKRSQVKKCNGEVCYDAAFDLKENNCGTKTAALAKKNQKFNRRVEHGN